MNKRMMTYRKDKITLLPNVVYQMNFRNVVPNHFILNNSINDVVYISDTPTVSNLNYSKKIVGVCRQLYAEINGIHTLYLISTTGGEITIESYYSEFTESSIAGDIGVVSNTDLSSPIAQNVSLTGTVEFVLKSTPGWIITFGAGSSPYTEIRNGTGNTIWTGDYIAGQPFYCDTNIILYCPVDNDYVSIVYL